MIKRVFSAFILLLLFVPNAHARPEYAAKQKLNCFACHVTPWGGGPRNLTGKQYGGRGLGTNAAQLTDLFYADLRAIAYYPLKSATKTKNGIALMQASATGNIPLAKDEKTQAETRAVLTYNIAPLGGAYLREAYVRWQLPMSESSQPTYVLLGRFYMPFGLLTDNHRTYTRIQTNMTLNNYNVGAALSGNFSNELHYDLVLVNDFQTGGGFTTNDFTLGSVFNLRWNALEYPFFFGVSGNYEHTTAFPAPYAGSLYGVLSLDRVSREQIHGALLFETVAAKNWNSRSANTGLVNPGLNEFFVSPSDASYSQAIATTSSVGFQAKARIDLSNQWSVFYKFDELAPQSANLRDSFIRHGVGFEAHLTSNIILNTRIEKAVARDPEANDPGVPAAQDDVFSMFRVWL